MEEYVSYGLIQKHMCISESLYDIDLCGKHILSELRAKKNTKSGSRRGVLFNKDTEIVYNCINDTINVGRFKSRLYLTLIYYLDEALFNNISDEDEYFYIEDDKYELTKLYFDQFLWVKLDIQKFALMDGFDINVEEALLIMCYFNKYSKVLDLIEMLLENISDDVRYKRKIIKVIGRIRNKHCVVKNIMEDIIKAAD